MLKYFVIQLLIAIFVVSKETNVFLTQLKS